MASPESGYSSTIADRNGFGNVCFCGRGKTGVPEEKTSEKGREPTTNSAQT